MRTFTTLLLLGIAGLSYAQNVIYAYAVGDWRNGPVVTISPSFETTEAFSTLQLIARVKKDYGEFAKITDIEVQRFATVEECEMSRTTLAQKYHSRKLEVNMLAEQETAPADAPAAPQ